MNRRRLAALLVVPALALTACGGDGGPEPSPPAQPAPGTPSVAPSGAGGGTGGPGATPGAPSAARSKIVNDFVACMRKHGVDIPDDPRDWTPDGQDADTQKALMACIGRSGAPQPGS
ncbi:hypothetical protein [Actinomadura sp. KC345]|uniref:hypothetical protein n=1 Tax=Actinomadura sp. KC345 TaxID=2530371 RepID=UPI001404E32C|nr:hypothetical protein [Actinomadura sp. KC345]